MKMIKMIIFYGKNSGIQAIYGENYQRLPPKKKAMATVYPKRRDLST